MQVFPGSKLFRLLAVLPYYTVKQLMDGTWYKKNEAIGGCMGIERIFVRGWSLSQGHAGL